MGRMQVTRKTSDYPDTSDDIAVRELYEHERDQRKSSTADVG